MAKKLSTFTRRERISDGTAFLMLFTGIGFDATQTLFSIPPILGYILPPLVGLTSFMTFFTWYKIRGVRFTENAGRILMVWMGGMMLGAIDVAFPLFDIVPDIVVSVLLTTAIVKADDRKYNEEQAARIQAENAEA